MINRKQTLLTALLITLAAPEITLAQSVFESVNLDTGSASFSTSNLPLQSNYSPLDSAVNLGKDIYGSNSESSDTGGYQTSSLAKVDDIYQDAQDSKPSILKDLFLGPDDKRALHPTTVKVFDILGKAQKGLQTYKLGRGAFDAIKGKSPGGIVGNVRSILALYGVIDPNNALATVGKGQQSDTLSRATANAEKIKKAALGKPETPSQWYAKGINSDAIASMAAQTGPDIVLGTEGQEQLKQEDEFSAASAEALQAVISDAATSAVQVRGLEQASQEQAATSAEVAQGAQKRKSTQQAVKDLNALAGIQANLAATQVSTLAELNDNTLRGLGGMASVVGMQQAQLNKTTTMQLMTALNGRQLANINSGVQSSHDYQVQKDLQVRKRRGYSLGKMVIPRPVHPQNAATTATNTTQGGQP